MILRFLRNKVVEVEPQPDGSITASWRLTDDLLRAEVKIRLQLPDLEIVEATATLGRLVPKAWSAAQLALNSGAKGIVTLDKVIRVMKRTGDDMRREYKETSEGGLAVNLPEC